MRNTVKKESEIEQKAIRLARQQFGCSQIKLYERFWPDRLVLMPGGVFAFIEFKRPGGRLSEGQKIQFSELRELGFEVYVVWSIEEYLTVLETLRGKNVK